jgi:hypothetical protein
MFPKLDQRGEISREHVLAPWQESPYRLISWWDMERFSAMAFYQIGKLLEKVCTEHEMYRAPGDAMFTGSGANHVLTQDRVRGLQEFMQPLIGHCSGLGLQMSVHQMQFISDNAALFTNSRAASELQQLDKMIRWEMENHLFFFVSPTEAELYQQKEPLFGPEVQNNFPAADFDISEAGKCLALRRSTACVMHLNRVVEVGLRTLATKELGLPFRPDWGRHLTDIEKELTNRYKAAGVRTPDEQFFSEAAAQIGHIKTAWRNPSMHVDRKYTEDEAKGILQAVRSFMQHLATKLHE